MLAAGINRRSHSQWASPLHLVQGRPDGSWRPCDDFRRLNLVTAADKYPLPNMADFVAGLDGLYVLFGRLDLNKGYLPAGPVSQGGHPKDSAHHSVCLFKFVRMPFGL
jgi:hypothetical protein